MKNKKTVAWLLLLIMFLQAVYSPELMARSSNRLSLNEAMHHAVKNSPGLRDTRIERIKKNIQRREAIEAIKMARRREKFPWFSLLMSVNLPVKHALPREIELLMKVPEIQTELQNLREREKYEILKARHDAQVAYLDVLLAKYFVQRQELYLRETRDTLAKVRQQHRIGLGDIKDVEYLEKELEACQKNLQKAVQDLEQKLAKLSRLTNIRLNINTQFDEYLPNVDINRDHLDKIVNHSLKHDFGLFKATQDRKIAQTEVLELIGIYENRWGGRVSNMTRYIKSQLGQQVERLDVRLNYDVFINNYYHPALNRIEEPFSGSFKIRILFITIRIPKEWFKLGTMAERYFDNEKYALFNALVEREKAIDLENDVRESLIQQVRNTYFTLKQMEAAYAEGLSNQQRSERNYLMSLRGNQLGLVPFQELHSEKVNFYKSQDSLYEMLIDYGKTIAMFNLYTSGYLDVLQGDFDVTDLIDGDSFITGGAGGPTWYIVTTLTDYKFTFGVNIPEDLGVTDFELFTSNHVQIGERTVVSNTISHLPIVLQDNTELYVKLYKDNQLVYIAHLDGFDITGPLVLVSASQDEQVIVAPVVGEGTWQLNNLNMFQTRFTFDLQDQLTWDQFGLFYIGQQEALLGGELLGYGQGLVHLPTSFADPEKLVLRLYKDGQVISSYSLLEPANGVGLLIKK